MLLANVLEMYRPYLYRKCFFAFTPFAGRYQIFNPKYLRMISLYCWTGLINEGENSFPPIQFTKFPLKSDFNIVSRHDSETLGGMIPLANVYFKETWKRQVIDLSARSICLDECNETNFVPVTTDKQFGETLNKNLYELCMHSINSGHECGERVVLYHDLHLFDGYCSIVSNSAKIIPSVFEVRIFFETLVSGLTLDLRGTIEETKFPTLSSCSVLLNQLFLSNQSAIEQDDSNLPLYEEEIREFELRHSNLYTQKSEDDNKGMIQLNIEFNFSDFEKSLSLKRNSYSCMRSVEDVFHVPALDESTLEMPSGALMNWLPDSRLSEQPSTVLEMDGPIEKSLTIRRLRAGERHLKRKLYLDLLISNGIIPEAIGSQWFNKKRILSMESNSFTLLTDKLLRAGTPLRYVSVNKNYRQRHDEHVSREILREIQDISTKYYFGIKPLNKREGCLSSNALEDLRQSAGITLSDDRKHSMKSRSLLDQKMFFKMYLSLVSQLDFSKQENPTIPEHQNEVDIENTASAKFKAPQSSQAKVNNDENKKEYSVGSGSGNRPRGGTHSTSMTEKAANTANNLQDRQEDFGFEVLVANYLQLHSNCNDADSLSMTSSKRTPIRVTTENDYKANMPSTAPVTASNLLDNNASRPAPIPTMDISPSGKLLRGLPILISEELLESNLDIVRMLGEEENGSLLTIDCPIQPPVSMILDSSTGLCLLSESMVHSRAQMKGYMKELTKIAFKYKVIWLIIMREEYTSWFHGEDFISLCQCFSEFPCKVNVREATTYSIPPMIKNIIKCNADDYCSKYDRLLSDYTNRKFLMNLSSSEESMYDLDAQAAFTAHCEFLQQFPTINYYVAAAIIDRWSLRQMTKISSDELCAFLNTDCDEEISDFYTLLTKQIGLTSISSH